MDRNTWVRLMLNFETSISLLNKWPKLIHPQILSLRKFFTNHVTNHSVKFSKCNITMRAFPMLPGTHFSLVPITRATLQLVTFDG